MSRSNREAHPELKKYSSILKAQMPDQQRYWFAARTRDKQEFAVRNFLEKLKLEEKLEVEYYLPTKKVVRQLKYRKKCIEIPVIRNLIFVHATKQTACDFSNKYGVQLYYMKDLSTHGMLIVPNKQMDDFIFVMDLAPDGISFNNESLSIGSRVRVVKGNFSGIEGEVATDSNKTYIVICIKDILTASIKVPKSYLKVIE